MSIFNNKATNYLTNYLQKSYNNTPKIPIWINIILILLAIILSILTLPNINNINIQNNIGETKHLSYNQQVEDFGDDYTIDFEIKQSWYTQKNFDFYVSNCLEKVIIQGDIVLGQKSQTSYTDADCYGKASFVIENTDPETITVTVVAKNLNSPLVIFRPTIASWQGLLLLILIIINLVILIANLCKKFNLGVGVWVVFLLSVLLHIHYLGYTVANDRSYDIFFSGGHLDYIKHLVNTWTLPDPNTGWETFQPPLYYILAGIVWSAFGNMAGGMFALQVLSLILFSVFSWFGILILQTSLDPFNLNSNLNTDNSPDKDTKNDLKNVSKYFLLASALFLFIPSGTIHSIRLGNDVLQYLTYTIALYYTILIWQDLTTSPSLKKNLILGSIAIFASIITKSNGLIIGLILLITLAIKFQKTLKQTILKTYVFAIPILTILLGISINFGRNIIANPTNTSKWIVSSVDTIDPLLAGTNSWYTYFIFHFEGFLTQSFTDTRYDDARNYFWTFLLKTSLFGEFKFYDFIQPELALIISWLCLTLVLLFVFNVIRNIKNTTLRNSPLLREYPQSGGGLLVNHIMANLVTYLNLIFMLVGLIYYRWKMPFVSNNDFRYIYPISISFVVLMFSNISNVSGIFNRFFSGFVVIISILFVFCSSVFFVNYGYFNLSRQNLPTKDMFYDQYFLYNSFVIDGQIIDQPITETTSQPIDI